MVSDLNDNTKNGEQICMVGDFNIDAKSIWDSMDDAKCMRIVEFAAKHGMDSIGSGAPTLSWRHPSSAFYDKEGDCSIVKGRHRGEVHTGNEAGPVRQQAHFLRAPLPQRDLCAGTASTTAAAAAAARQVEGHQRVEEHLGKPRQGRSELRLQLGLEGVRRQLEGYEGEGEDFEDETLKAQCEKLGAKRAA